MMLSPALSWMCLLPQGSSFHAATIPTWLNKELSAVEQKRDGDQVLLTSAALARSRQQFDQVSGVVAVNRKASDAELKQAGFNCIRRFAVLPSWQQPRWFIPLDSSAVSASAFELYQPFRRSARLKCWIAKTLARLGIPIWFRDQLLIAHRQPLPLETTLQQVVGASDPVRVAISSGSVAAAEGRKLSLAVLDQQGKILAYAKRSLSDESRKRVDREAETLHVLNQRDARCVPKLLHHGDVEGSALLVTEPLRGSAPGTRFSTAHEHFLTRLRNSSKPPAETELVQSLVRRVQKLSDALLENVLFAALKVLEGTPIACGVVHRDFAPWNVRVQSAELAAFDWESAALDGPALLDETHHELAVQFFVQRCSPETAFRRLETVASSSPLGLAKPCAQALQALYLVDHTTQLVEEGYAPDYPKLVWWRSVLDQLSPTVVQMAAARGSQIAEASLPLAEAVT